MIVTQIEEIRAYLPTSSYRSPEGLLSLMEDAEESYLVPILGRELYNKVEEIYDEILSDHNGVTPLHIPKEEMTDSIRLVRMCQMPVVYFALANSSGILSVSLNDGGGFSQMSTDTYEAAGKDAIERFERDAFFKARRGIDRLLIFLEEDARSEEPKYAEMWKKSGYFYLQGDLLFTTAIEMNRFIDIHSSREQFIGMIPDIRYCQMAYLSQEIGTDLLTAIIRSQTDSSIVPSVESNEEDEKKDPNNDENKRVWKEASDFLKMALALFVECRKPEKKRRYSENEAYLSLYRAKEYISENQESFGEYIKKSPLYTQPSNSDNVGNNACPFTGSDTFNNEDPNNAIFVFGSPGINRH